MGRTPTGRTFAVRAYVSLVAAGAALLWAGGVATSGGSPALPWPLLAVAFAVVNLVTIQFGFRGEAHGLTVSEVPVLVGLVFCGPSGTALAAVTGLVAADGIVQRKTPVKLIFNGSVAAITVAVAEIVYRPVLGSATAVSPRGWLAALLAVLAADAASHLCVLGVVAVVSGHLDRRSITSLLVAAAVAAPVNTVLGLITITVLWVDRRSAVLLLVLIGVLALGYRSHALIRQRYARLSQLYEFTRILSEPRPAGEVTGVVLDQAATLLRAQTAELVLPLGEGFRVVRLIGERTVDCQLAEHRLASAVLASRAPVLIDRDERHHAGRALIEAKGWKDAIAAAVPGAPTCVLVVADREGDVTTFDGDDLRLFETLANAAAAALRAGRLLDRLRAEVASKDHQALHDGLTGLANRTLFTKQVSAALAERREHDPTPVVGLLLMDLDGFKEVNDTLGHHVGDTLLKHVAVRLVRSVGPRGSVARLGGDEFAVVLPDAIGVTHALALAASIREALCSPLTVDDLRLEIGVSIGVALAPEHGVDPGTLLQRADVAMYAAKARNSGLEIYRLEHDHSSGRRLALSADLRDAVANGGITVHYQPQHDVVGGHLTGFEALARWNHPVHGVVPPDEFILVAEQSGLIRPLTLVILDTALRQLSAWRADRHDLRLAVNLSPRSLLDTSIVGAVADLVACHGVPPCRLTLELTETSVMADLNRSAAVLTGLADLGVHLAIDDFGTGYSSLSRLQRLPFDELKIDRSFVMRMASSESDLAIVRSTIDLARNLGLRVVAEGVEDNDTLGRLEALGCDAVQGYLVGMPAPAAELWARLHGSSHETVLDLPRSSAGTSNL